MDLGQTLSDPMWQMPLLEAEDDIGPALIDQDADFISDPDNGKADHINAALWLFNSVKRGSRNGDGLDGVKWMHLDFNALNKSAKPRRPRGGAEIGIRTFYEHISNSFAR